MEAIRPGAGAEEGPGVVIDVFLSATLRSLVPGYDPATGRRATVPEGATAAAVCGALGIPAEKVKIVMVNGRSASLADALADGDRLALFPPVGGG